MADDETEVTAFGQAEVKGAEGDGQDNDGGGSKDGEEEEEEEFVFQPSPEWAEKGQATAAPETWTYDHGRLCYLMSLYATCAQSAEDNEGWLRQLPLNVLMFQGITSGVLDFDYAPCSALISSGGRSQRVWLNVTQEGKAAIDDLREAGIINGLKVGATVPACHACAHCVVCS